MKLQTQIPLTRANNPIDYSSQLLVLGSCFSENIGAKLDYFKFQTVQNPFGILFHPLAIENLISRAVKKEYYSADDLFFLNERWHCFDVHSSLSDVRRDALLENLNAQLVRTENQLRLATHILITLGTAWVYQKKQTGKMVANCHKVPQKEFKKHLLTVNEITASLQRSVQHIESINKKAQLIFTISPVRHLKDGFIENERSKSHLITAIHTILSIPPSGARGIYFPSYEIMMDELRDYRFYKMDMIHPNTLAIDYIWEKFSKVWISDDAQVTVKKVEEIQRGLRHRPFNPNSEQHQRFQESLKEKISYIKKEHPFMTFE
ncbi:GSCFA domain-containing protein [Maribacter sp. R77961]|uniref:GSCFA domain-containing protein n=1 Tax=Maribacter sp. R77961 TaxID=3093871 RepID=UPI0037C5CE3F